MTVTISDHACSWLKLVKFAYDRPLIAWLKTQVGARYLPESALGKHWELAYDLVNSLVAEASRLKHKICDKRTLPSVISRLSPGNPKLRKYQRETARRLVQAGRQMLCYDMGLGKTATAIEAIRTREGISNVLVICPGIARLTWRDELAKWGDPTWSVWIQKKGKDVPEKGEVRRICWYVTTPGLLGTLNKHDLRFQAIIIDESHFYNTFDSARTKTLLTLIEKQNPLLLACLTGTPITDQPGDIYQQLQIVAPGLLYPYTRFVSEYLDHEWSIYGGLKIHGLNLTTADALRKRIAPWIVRLTEDDVADQLPPLVTSVIHLRDIAIGNAETAQESIDRIFGAKDRLGAERIFSKQGRKHHDDRIKAACEWVEKCQPNERIAIMCYHLETAAILERDLPLQNRPIAVVTGATPNLERAALIQSVAGAENAAVICTMKSVGISINDLVAWRRVLFVELPYQVDVLEQSMRRFYRMTSAGPVYIYFLCARGTSDELVMASISKKLKNVNRLIGSGAASKKVAESLGGSSENWQEQAAKASAAFRSLEGI